MQRYIGALWVVLAVVWFIGALKTKRVARNEPSVSRLTHIVVLWVAFLLVFSSRRPAGSLAWRVVPWPVEAGYIGLALTAVGIALAIWARLNLGGNWSGTVTIKEGHTLVVRGPYRLVRHPIYTGLWTASLGTAIGYGELRGFIGSALVLLAFWYKARVEERLLTEQFGPEYERYRRGVRMLIPFVL